MKTIQGTIAREWLVFLASIPVGLLGTYLMFYHFDPPHAIWGMVGYEAQIIGYASAPMSYFTYDLFTRPFRISSWLSVFTPYLAYLLGRSIAWSVRTLRGERREQQ